MGPYGQPRHLLGLLERVLKVLGWLTTPDGQVGQHRLQVRRSECRPTYLPTRGGQPPQHLQSGRAPGGQEGAEVVHRDP